MWPKKAVETAFIVLDVAEEGGLGTFTNLFIQDTTVPTDRVYEKYLK